MRLFEKIPPCSGENRSLLPQPIGLDFVADSVEDSTKIPQWISKTSYLLWAIPAHHLAQTMFPSTVWALWMACSVLYSSVPAAQHV